MEDKANKEPNGYFSALEVVKNEGLKYKKKIDIK